MIGLAGDLSLRLRRRPVKAGWRIFSRLSLGAVAAIFPPRSLRSQKHAHPGLAIGWRPAPRRVQRVTHRLYNPLDPPLNVLAIA